MKRPTPKALAALAGMILSWSSIPLFLKHFTGELDAWTVNGFRYGTAAVLLLPLLRKGSAASLPGRSIWRDALLPSAVNSFGQIGWALLPYYMPASVMGFGVRAAFLFTLIGSLWLLPEERYLFRSGRFWMGAFVCVLGFGGLVRGSVRASHTSVTGLLLLLGTAAVWGFYGVAVRRNMTGHAPQRRFAVISLYTAAVVAILTFIRGDVGALAAVSWKTVAMLVLSAVLGVALAHILMFYVLDHLGAVIEGGSEMATPFLTFVGAALIFGERLSVLQWAGGVGVIAGCGLMIAAHRPSARSGAGRLTGE